MKLPFASGNFLRVAHVVGSMFSLDIVLLSNVIVHEHERIRTLFSYKKSKTQKLNRRTNKRGTARCLYVLLHLYPYVMYFFVVPSIWQAQVRKAALNRVPEQIILSEMRKMVQDMQAMNKKLEETVSFSTLSFVAWLLQLRPDIP